MTMRLNASGKRKIINLIQLFLETENEQQRELLINRFEFHSDDLLDIVSESLPEAKAHSAQYEQLASIYDALGLKDWAKRMRLNKQTVDTRIQRAEQNDVWVSIKETSLEKYPYPKNKNGEPPFKEPKPIALTLDEAKKISTFFDVVDCCAYGFKLSDEEKILWETLEKRIDKVENGDEA